MTCKQCGGERTWTCYWLEVANRVILASAGLLALFAFVRIMISVGSVVIALRTATLWGRLLEALF